MQWFIVAKLPKNRPTSGTHYWQWKEPLAKEGREQCVYCCINIHAFGGIRNFHIEHYKPKSLPEFKSLKDDFDNLFFACAICNSFKGADWPNEPTERMDICCYPDPSKVDYSTFLSVKPDYSLASHCVTGSYIIGKLFLNRPQLIMERKKFLLLTRIKYHLSKIEGILESLNSDNVDNPLIELAEVLIDSIKTIVDEGYVNPYTIAQVSK